MDVKAALESAIAFEKRVRDAYRSALERIDSPELKEMLMALARDEHEHLNYLRDSYKLWVSTGQLIADVMKSDVDRALVAAWLERARAPLHGLGGRESARETLAAVLAVEEEAASFYQTVESNLMVAERRYFSRFVDVEQAHVAAVRAMLAAVG